MHIYILYEYTYTHMYICIYIHERICMYTFINVSCERTFAVSAKWSRFRTQKHCSK